MKENTILYLSGSDLKSLLRMEDCIEAMSQAFRYLGTGEAVMPLRTALELEKNNATALFMPAYLPSIGKVCIKTVNTNRNNPSKGIPLIHALLTVYDAETGVPLAIMDGECITAMRTGAVSGLATSLLARNDCSTAAIIGTGHQGATQLEAITAVRNIRKVYVYDISKERSEAFAQKMSEQLKLQILPSSSLEMLKQVDIICTSTSSTTPVFDNQSISPGTHINGVGSFKPGMAEIPSEVLARAKVVLDQMEGCLAEAGDIIQPIEQGLFTREHLHGDLGQLVTGSIAGRQSDEEITVFKSVGVAVQDLMTAELAITLAESKGVGTVLTL